MTESQNDNEVSRRFSSVESLSAEVERTLAIATRATESSKENRPKINNYILIGSAAALVVISNLYASDAPIPHAGLGISFTSFFLSMSLAFYNHLSKEFYNNKRSYVYGTMGKCLAKLASARYVIDLQNSNLPENEKKIIIESFNTTLRAIPLKYGDVSLATDIDDGKNLDLELSNTIEKLEKLKSSQGNSIYNSILLKVMQIPWWWTTGLSILLFSTGAIVSILSIR